MAAWAVYFPGIAGPSSFEWVLWAFLPPTVPFSSSKKWLEIGCGPLQDHIGVMRFDCRRLFKLTIWSTPTYDCLCCLTTAVSKRFSFVLGDVGVGVVPSHLWTECAAQAWCWNQSWTTNWRREVVNWRWQARPLTPSWSSTSRGRWRRTPSHWSIFVGSVVRHANRGMSVQTTLRSGSSNRISTLPHDIQDLSRQTLNITLLESWQQVHHLKIVRSCPYCGMDQTSRGGLRQHISRKHREEHRLAKGLKSSGRIRASMDHPLPASFTSSLAPPLTTPSAAPTSLLTPTTVASLLDLHQKLQSPRNVVIKSEVKE